MKNRFYVYSYSTEKDGVFWIGKGTGKRMTHSHSGCPICHKILQKRKRQGIKVIKKKILENLAEQKAFLEEIILIYLYEPKANLTFGGEGTSGCIKSEETKRKMSEVHKGKTLSEETKKKLSKAHGGINHTKKTKKKMSEATRGKNNPMFGKVHSEETKKKISESHQGEKNPMWGKAFSEEHKKKISEANKGNSCAAHLVWEQVKEIRERHANEKTSYVKLGKEYGVSGSTVCRIINNQAWKTK